MHTFFMPLPKKRVSGSSRPTLTAALVGGSAKPEENQYDLQDNPARGVKGLYMRVYPSGRRTFFFRRGRGEKAYRIGAAGPMLLDRARDEAGLVLGELKRGNDPGLSKETNTLKFGAYLDDIYEPHFTAHHPSVKNLSNLKPFRIWDKKALTDITIILVRSWRTKRLTKGLKPSTINRNVAALKASLSHAVDEAYLQMHPLIGLSRLPVEEENRVRYLSADEEKSLREALIERENYIREKRKSGNQWSAERDYQLRPDLSNYKFADHLRPMVLIAMNTGIRQGELFSLAWADVVDKTITVQSGKTKNRRTRYVPLNKEALNTITHWREQSDSKQYIFESREGKPFNNVKKAWMGVLADAGIVDFRWHDLRHHFASKLVVAAIPLNTVRELLGHSDIKMTLRYAHLAPGHMREAVEVLNT